MFRKAFTGLMAIGACHYAPCQTPTPVRSAGDPMPDAKLASIPDFVLPERYRDRTGHPLPASVDNSKHPFFVPIGTWRQQGSSCANAQAVSLVYGFEAQSATGAPSSGTAPVYTYEYTYHFLNDGNAGDGGDGWMFVEAMDLLKATGAATSADFGGLEWGNSFIGWMSGYEKYHRAMKVRASEYYKIDISAPAGDELVKQYLHDHGDGSPLGGSLVVQVRFENLTRTTVGGRPVISNFQKSAPLNHAFTICGYDDAFNGGSWLVHNTHGDGLYWVPYSLFRANGPIATAQGTPVMFCRVRKDYSPRYALKVTLTHNQRGNIAVMTGFAPSAAAAAPTAVKDYAGAFNFSGGLFPMVGRGQSATLEFGLDVTDFIADAGAVAAEAGTAAALKDARFFLHVVSKGGTGRIDKVSLMDYTGAAVREIPTAESGTAIAPNAVTTVSIALDPASAIRSRPGAGYLPGAFLTAARNGGPLRIPLHGMAGGPVVLDIRDAGGRSVFEGKMDLARGASGSAVFPWGMETRQGGKAPPGLYFSTAKPLDDRNGNGNGKTGSTALIRIVE